MDTPATQADIDRIKQAALVRSEYLLRLADRLDEIEVHWPRYEMILIDATRELRQLASK